MKFPIASSGELGEKENNTGRLVKDPEGVDSRGGIDGKKSPGSEVESYLRIRVT